jgi:hypothetical protein
MEEGQLALPSEYGEDMIVTRRMIEDGREHLVLRDAAEPRAGADAAGHGGCGCAHGGGDAPAGPPGGADIRLELVKGADHRFSEPACLDTITRALEEVLTLG